MAPDCGNHRRLYGLLFRIRVRPGASESRREKQLPGGFEVKLNTSDQSPVPGKEEKGIE
jgi:hypothetical protein